MRDRRRSLKEGFDPANDKLDGVNNGVYLSDDRLIHYSRHHNC